MGKTKLEIIDDCSVTCMEIRSHYSLWGDYRLTNNEVLAAISIMISSPCRKIC